MASSNQRWHQLYRDRPLSLPYTSHEYDTMTMLILKKHAQLLSIPLGTHRRKAALIASIQSFGEKLSKEKFDDWKSRMIRLNKQLDSAVNAGDLNKAQLLVKYGADVNCKTKGDSVLFKSITNGDVDIFELLIASGAHVDNYDDSVRKVIISQSFSMRFFKDSILDDGFTSCKFQIYCLP